MRSQTKSLRRDGHVAKSKPRKQRDPLQPHLPFDKMPERIEPALALLKTEAPHGDQWIFELKLDGYRLAIHIEPKGVRILTRGGHDWTERFPAIAEAATKLVVGTAILDGEAVVLDANGRSDFSALQRSLGGRGGKLASAEAIFYAFDLLYFDGHLLTKAELSVRRHLLADLLNDCDGGIRMSEEMDGDGDELMAAACAHGLEGIIAKNRDTRYRSGRTGDWLKIKCVQSESFVIIGYEQSSVARGGIGSLLLAAKDGAALRYVGSVGTGFKEAGAVALRSTFNSLETKRPVVPIKGKNLIFVQPTLIAEVNFRGWTDDRILRHASYKGLREVQDNANIYDLGAETETRNRSKSMR